MSKGSAGMDDGRIPEGSAGMDDGRTPEGSAGMDDERTPEESVDMDDGRTPEGDAGADDEKPEIPPLDFLRMELAREEARHEFRRSLLHVAGVLTVAAAVAALVATRIFMLLQINGMSMSPTLEEGEIIMVRQTKDIEKGDIVGFYYGGKVLLKRVIGSGGDTIDIDEEGNVYVNGGILDEPYLKDKGLGKCELVFPYEVSEGMIFVLGDNREVSMDSRIRVIGCVDESQIAGKAEYRIWPLARMGIIH